MENNFMDTDFIETEGRFSINPQQVTRVEYYEKAARLHFEKLSNTYKQSLDEIEKAIQNDCGNCNFERDENCECMNKNILDIIKTVKGEK